MDIWHVDSDHIDEVWNEVKDFVKRTDDADLTSDDVYKSLISGNWRLWIGIGETGAQVAATTSFALYPTGKMCRVETIGGDGMEEWLHALQSIEEWAKLNGCIAMDIFGRKGWEKVLAPQDYKFEAVLLRKRL